MSSKEGMAIPSSRHKNVKNISSFSRIFSSHFFAKYFRRFLTKKEKTHFHFFVTLECRVKNAKTCERTIMKTQKTYESLNASPKEKVKKLNFELEK